MCKLCKKEISIGQIFIHQEILLSVLNLLKLCDYSLAFEFQGVYLTALVRNCFEANDIDGICIVFYKKPARWENASKLLVLYKVHFTPAV